MCWFTTTYARERRERGGLDVSERNVRDRFSGVFNIQRGGYGCSLGAHSMQITLKRQVTCHDSTRIRIPLAQPPSVERVNANAKPARRAHWTGTQTCCGHRFKVWKVGREANQKGRWKRGRGGRDVWDEPQPISGRYLATFYRPTGC